MMNKSKSEAMFQNDNYFIFHHLISVNAPVAKPKLLPHWMVNNDGLTSSMIGTYYARDAAGCVV